MTDAKADKLILHHDGPPGTTGGTLSIEDCPKGPCFVLASQDGIWREFPEDSKCGNLGVLTWRPDRDPTDANESFERAADVFYKATGFLAPGKDGCTRTAEVEREWGVWCAAIDYMKAEAARRNPRR